MPDHPTEQVDRVAVVLRKHTPGYCWRNCTEHLGDWAEHVAEQVCAALDAATPPLAPDPCPDEWDTDDD